MAGQPGRKLQAASKDPQGSLASEAGGGRPWKLEMSQTSGKATPGSGVSCPNPGPCMGPEEGGMGLARPHGMAGEKGSGHGALFHTRG